MKRIIALLLAVVMIFAFSGCGKKADTLKIGYTIYEPMNFLGEDGKLTGLIQNLQKLYVKSLAKHLNLSKSTGIQNSLHLMQVRLTVSGMV